MFNKKSLSDAKLEAETTIKMLEEAINQLKSLFYTEALTSLKSDYMKERISKIEVFLNVIMNKLKSIKSKIPKN